MEVSILARTDDPIKAVSVSAAVCYGKRDVKPSRIEKCFKLGHMSVFEHASVTFLVEEISRACSHQLVRHRMASYSMESQRYCKYDLGGDDWYVVPPFIANEDTGDPRFFAYRAREYGDDYMDMLANGVKPEDARYMLPEATKTCIAVTMNLREFFHFLDLRTDKHAQWEIRELAWKMVHACEHDENLAYFMDLWKTKRGDYDAD